jgi:predicted MFS family arabinose efflux permease
MRGYKWWVVAMLWFVCFFNYADRQAIFSVFPLLREEMGLSNVQLGFVAASFSWVYAAFGPIAGMVGDRVQRKTLILGGLIFWSLVTLATALSRDYWHLLLFRSLEGLGEAFYFPAAMSVVADYHSPATRSRAMSLHQSSVYAGTIAGGTLAGYTGQLYGWRSGFYIFGSLGVLLGVVLWTFLREPERGAAEAVDAGAHGVPPRGAPFWATVKEVYSHPMARILTIVFVGANFVALIYLSWMPSFLHDKFGMTLAMAGFSATAYLQIASVLGVLTGGFLADRLARRFRGGRMMAQATGLFLGVPFIFLSGWTVSVPVLVLALVGFGYFKGMYDANIWASLYDVVRPERRASALGFMNSIGWLGGGLAPVAIGAMSERYGMSGSISATSGIYLSIGLLMVFGIRRYMRGSPARIVAAPAAA